MSTQNVNVACFARNVEWDFLCDYKHRAPVCVNWWCTCMYKHVCYFLPKLIKSLSIFLLLSEGVVGLCVWSKSSPVGHYGQSGNYKGDFPIPERFFPVSCFDWLTQETESYIAATPKAAQSTAVDESETKTYV